MMISARFFAFNSTNSTLQDASLVDFYLIYVPTAVLFMLAILIGLVGNTITIGAVLRFRSLRLNPTYIVLGSQSLADLLVSVVVGLATLTGSLLGGEFYFRHDFLCQAIAAICLVSCAATLLSMGFLALNRYLAIIYPKSYKRWFTLRKAAVYCLITWLASFLIEVVNFTEIGGRLFDQKTKSCLFDRLKKGFTIPFVVICIYLPCIVISICYLQIFLFIKQVKGRVQNQVNSAKSSRLTILVAKSLFAAFFLFAICWLPLSVIYLVGFEDYLPAWLHAYSNLLAHVNSALNPILYALYNPTLRDAYKIIFRKLTCSCLFPSFKSNRLSCSESSSRKNLQKNTILA
nr:G protein-coupled receptor [Proales similis]